ncbi:hypothetical protein BC827DRAFT_1091355, partial [Russula dissimulans]
SKAMTEADKEWYRKEGRCYECGKQGHIVWACPTRKNASSSSQKAKMEETPSMVEEEEPPLYEKITKILLKYSDEERAALRTRSLYIAKNKSISVEMTCYIKGQKFAIYALLDSGATECFLHPKTVAKIGLPTYKLMKPKQVKNVDGTINAAGTIREYTQLCIKLEKLERTLVFYITNIGTEEAILSYPFL